MPYKKSTGAYNKVSQTLPVGNVPECKHTPQGMHTILKHTHNGHGAITILCCERESAYSFTNLQSILEIIDSTYD